MFATFSRSTGRLLTLCALGAGSVACSGAESGGRTSGGVAESAPSGADQPGFDAQERSNALPVEARLEACAEDPRVLAGLVTQSVCAGADIFFRETFDGNGRTCGSCHPV